jgi:hypothetical protein
MASWQMRAARGYSLHAESHAAASSEPAPGPVMYLSAAGRPRYVRQVLEPAR